MDDGFRERLDEFLGVQQWPEGGLGAFGVPSRAPLTVTKATAWIQVPTELLMDEGVIPDTRPRVRAPWYRRLRWRAERWRERAARRAYRVISGEWPHEPDPYE